MNIKHPISVLTLTLTPFFIATGCSSTGGQHPASITESTPPYITAATNETPDNNQTFNQISTHSRMHEVNTPDNNTSNPSMITETINEATPNEAQDEISVNIVQAPSPTNTQIDSAPEELEVGHTPENDNPAESTGSNAPRPAKHVFQFGFNKAELSDEEKTIIRDHGQFLASHPSQSIVVHGHADTQGDQNYNQLLSEKRAQHVAALLKEAGASKNQIETFSWSSASPADLVTNYKANRRVELRYDQGYFAKKTQ